jgi:hypothetical protein
MFASLNKDQILLDFKNVKMTYLIRVGQNACDGARKHLHRGLLVRVDMMEESVVELHKEFQAANGPLSSYLAMRLTLLINAYYLNLAGSLDNIARALIYQHALCEPVDEHNLKQRKFAQLLGRDFLDALRDKGLNELRQLLCSKHEWYREMKEFRDPAAHRIPIIVPWSLYSEADVNEHRRLDSEATELFARGEHREGMATWRKANRLGQQLPVFASETSSLQIYDLAGRVNLDHGNWNALASACLSIGFT